MLNLAISGLMLMTLITIHLLQFRFGHTDQFGPYFSKPPKFLINFLGILTLDLLRCCHCPQPIAPGSNGLVANGRQ